MFNLLKQSCLENNKMNEQEIRNKIADEILDKHDMLCTGNNCLCKVIATQVKRG